MPHNGTLSIVLYIVMAIAMVLLAIWQKNRRQTGRRTYKTEKKKEVDGKPPERSWYSISLDDEGKKRWKNVYIPITISVIVIDAFLFLLYPTVVWKKVVDKLWLTLFAHVAYIYFIWCLEVSGEQWKKRTALIGIGVVVTTILTTILGFTPWFGEEFWIKRAQKARAGAIEKSSTSSGNFEFPKELEENEDAKTAYMFWMNSALPKLDAFEMFLICGEETSYTYHQFEPDGVTPLVGHNPDGTPNGAIGICQIKPESYGQLAKELSDSTGFDYSPETLAGNLRLALEIRKRDGAEKWETLPKVRSLMAQAPGSRRLGVQTNTRVERSVVRPVSNPIAMNLPAREEFIAPRGRYYTEWKLIPRGGVIKTDGTIFYELEDNGPSLTATAGEFGLGPGKIRFHEGSWRASFDTAPPVNVTLFRH